MLKHEGPSKHPKAGHHRPTSETPFEWRFAGGPMVARHFVLAGVLYLQNFYTFSIHITVAIDTVAKQFLISVLFLQKSHLMMASFLKFVYLSVGFLFLFLFVKRLLSNLNIMSLVAVKKRKSGKNRKDRNKVDRKVRKKGKFPVCVFSSSSGSRPIRVEKTNNRFYNPTYFKNRGSYRTAHVLLNLLNELGKRDKMRGLPSSLSFFRNEFKKINNKRVRMLDYIYHMTLRLLWNLIFGVKML